MSDPHSTEVEANLLGAVLLTSSISVDELWLDEGVRPEHFHKPSHGLVWEAMAGLALRGDAVDVTTVCAELDREGNLEQAGGPERIDALTGGVPVAGNARSYARIVVDLARWRRRLNAAVELQAAASARDHEAYVAAEARLAEPVGHGQRRVTVAQAIDSALSDLASIEDERRFPWPFRRLNDLSGGGMRPSQVTLMAGPTSHGKALDVDTPIPTPNGWTTMGALRTGAKVFGADGKPTTVVHAFDVLHDRDCYEVEFSDGATLVADADHEWLTWCHAARVSETVAAGRVERTGLNDQRHKRTRAALRTTRELAEGVEYAQWGTATPRRYSIAVAGPLAYPEQVLPIDPYVLGVWLGDGTSRSGQITTADPEVVLRVMDAGYVVSKHGGLYAWGIRGLTEALGRLGVLGPGRKHIPEIYQCASIEQRMELMRGLMDTDGTVSTRGKCDFVVTRRVLAEDFLRLARGLGLRATFGMRAAKLNGKACGTAYRVGFVTTRPVVGLERKRVRLPDKASTKATHRVIVAVRPVESRPVRCIAVDAPDHLYVAGEACIPTHNSVMAGMALESAMSGDEPPRACLYNNEMSVRELAERMIARTALLDHSRVASRDLSESELAMARRAASQLRDRPLDLQPCAGWSPQDICRHARRERYGLVCVDIINRLPHRWPTRVRDLQEASTEFNTLAEQTGAHVLLLAHVNRSRVSMDGSRPNPTLTDVRDCQSLADDANNVLFVWRNQDEVGDPTSEGVIRFAKARGAQLGGLQVFFDGPHQRFTAMDWREREEAAA